MKSQNLDAAKIAQEGQKVFRVRKRTSERLCEYSCGRGCIIVFDIFLFSADNLLEGVLGGNS